MDPLRGRLGVRGGRRRYPLPPPLWSPQNPLSLFGGAGTVYVSADGIPEGGGDDDEESDYSYETETDSEEEVAEVEEEVGAEEEGELTMEAKAAAEEAA